MKSISKRTILFIILALLFFFGAIVSIYLEKNEAKEPEPEPEPDPEPEPEPEPVPEPANTEKNETGTEIKT